MRSSCFSFARSSCFSFREPEELAASSGSPDRLSWLAEGSAASAADDAEDLAALTEISEAAARLTQAAEEARMKIVRRSRVEPRPSDEEEW